MIYNLFIVWARADYDSELTKKKDIGIMPGSFSLGYILSVHEEWVG